MLITVKNSAPFQILTSAMVIGPSQTGYQLEVAADGRNFSPLFSVGPNVTRQATNLSSGAYYRLNGNVGDVVVNWRTSCVTEGGGASGTELSPVTEFPAGAEAGTVVAYSGSSSANGVYQYTGEEWVPVGVDDLSAYWTSAQTQSAITSVEDHLFDVERVTASALTELHEDVLELSARTGGNSNILAAISSQTEYEAISGSVKTGDLIHVWDVDINGDGEPEYGLFENTASPGINWERKDNGDSLLYSGKDYPWMTDNGINPYYFGECLLVALDSPAGDDSYNGIGFDEDGKPVITHIVPRFEEGEITGITREDRDILSFPTGEDKGLSPVCRIITLDGKLFGEDLDYIPEFIYFEHGYSDEERGYTISQPCVVLGYYDGDENFVPVFLPAGTYALYDTDDLRTVNLFYGEIGGEQVIYNNSDYVGDLDIISLRTPFFTVTEPTCPTSEGNMVALYLNYTYKPSAQSQIDVLDEVVSAALVDLNGALEEKVQSLDVKNIVKLTQAEYDLIANPDPYTFYIIINNSN